MEALGGVREDGLKELELGEQRSLIVQESKGRNSDKGERKGIIFRSM